MNTGTPSRFQWRAFTSVALGLSFLALSLSGSVLFVAPPGRVANWTDWGILGLRKSEWSGLHIWFGAIFLAMSGLHLAFNWRPLLGYFRDRVSRRLAARREWAAAGLFCLLVFAGTQLGAPPFSSLLAWNEQWKESWDRSADRAPVPHAERLSLRELAGNAGVDPTMAVERLQAAGITKVDLDQAAQKLATSAGVSAQRIFELIRTDTPGRAGSAEKVNAGPGWKTLRQVCVEAELDYETARERLLAQGITVSEDATLREIAAKHDRRPYELLRILGVER